MEPNVSRRIKIYEATANDRNTPMLRLQGRWLKEAGFYVGNHVDIYVEEGVVVIIAKKEEQ